ncbi:MAG TPA: hypothetical protein VI197_29720, partial [Polyangiaceae bacterium]
MTTATHGNAATSGGITTAGSGTSSAVSTSAVSTSSNTAATGAGGGPNTGATSGAGFGGATATTSSSGGDPAIRFVGRVDRSDPGGERFAWSGSGLVAAFEGTQVSVSLNDASENQFTVLIDGELQPKLAAQAGSHDYLL